MLDEFWLNLAGSLKPEKTVSYIENFHSEKHPVLIHHHRKEMKQVKCTGSWQQTPFTKKKCYDQLDPNWAAAMSCLLEMHFFVQQILHSVHEAMKNAARLASCSEENRFSSLKENCLERYYSLFTNVFIAGCRKLPCTGPWPALSGSTSHQAKMSQHDILPKALEIQ